MTDHELQPDLVSPATRVIHPGGDLKLVVGEEEVEFIVSSRTLACKSAPLKIMLYGPYREGRMQQGSGDWVVHLPDDDPKTLHFILSVLHDPLTAIPDTLSSEAKVRVTALADKYDMTGALQRVWSRWLTDKVEGAGIELLTSAELLQYTWMCWRLGFGSGFQRGVVELLGRTSRSAGGQLQSIGFGLDTSDEQIEDWEVFDHLDVARQAVIRMYCDHVDAGMQALTDGSGCSRRSKLERVRCSHAMLSALRQELASRSLGDWCLGRMVRLEDIRSLPPLKLLGLLREIRRGTIKTKEIFVDGAVQLDHSDCAPWDNLVRVSDAGQIVPAVRNLVFSQEKHLENQAARSGLDPTLKDPAKAATEYTPKTPSTANFLTFCEMMRGLEGMIYYI